MKIDRKKNAVYGTIWGSVQKIISLVFPFIIRTVFIYTLGVEYLGLSSLFSSILQVLNLAELGVSSALVFSMFRPIVDDNVDKICALMKLYKTCYRVIGFIILLAGLVLAFFIPYLIDGEVPSDINIYVIYLMSLGSTVLSYWLFAYRNSLFNAHQRTDVLSIIASVVAVITYIIQILCLLQYRNYYLYLSINIVSTIAANLITAVASKKYYPMYSAKGDLPDSEKKEIWAKVRDLFTAKIGGVVNHSADSVVISAFLGLKILAVYQNYYYIISIAMGFFMIFYESCDAGIANSLIVNSKNDNRQLLYNINHCSFIVLNFCVTALICLYQPFMELWLGKAYLLDFSFVVLLAIYLVAEIAPRTLVVFKDAGGIWRKDRFRPLVVSFTNLISNLLLVKVIGLYGVIMSTIVTLLFIGYPWLMHNIDNYLFKINILEYLRKLVGYTLTMSICAIISYLVCCLFNSEKILLTLLYRSIIVLIIPNVLFCIVFGKSNEQKYFKVMVNDLVERIRSKVSR